LQQFIENELFYVSVYVANMFVHPIGYNSIILKQN
jgi:hypothetical protein